MRRISECKKFREIADSCIKHGESLMENLNKIKSDEVNEWLEKENGKATNAESPSPCN